MQGQALASAQCTPTRSSLASELLVPARTTCQSSARLTLTGAHLISGDDVQSFDFTGPAGEAMRDAILRSIREMQQAAGGARWNPTAPSPWTGATA